MDTNAHAGTTDATKRTEASKMKSITTRTPEETMRAGSTFASYLQKGDVVSLRGSLGAGKTVFAKGIAKTLGIEDNIVSPTFTLIQEYEGKMKMFHLDLYRLSGEDEFESMGGEDFLYPDGTSLIEWSEKIEDMLPDGTIYIDIAIADDLSRTITAEGGNHEYSFD